MPLKQGETIGCAARVQFTIEYRCGAWGSDCVLKQVYEQAGREATDKIERVLNNARLLGAYRVIGVPVVQAVMTTNYTEKELAALEPHKSVIEQIHDILKQFKACARGVPDVGPIAIEQLKLIAEAVGEPI